MILCVRKLNHFLFYFPCLFLICNSVKLPTSLLVFAPLWLNAWLISLTWFVLQIWFLAVSHPLWCMDFLPCTPCLPDLLVFFVVKPSSDSYVVFLMFGFSGLFLCLLPAPSVFEKFAMLPDLLLKTLYPVTLCRRHVSDSKTELKIQESNKNQSFIAGYSNQVQNHLLETRTRENVLLGNIGNTRRHEAREHSSEQRRGQ